MTADVRAILLMLLLSVSGVAADAALKSASLAKQPFLSGWFLLGCALSGCFAVIWVLVVQSVRLASAGLFYSIASALMLVVVGWVFFDERMSPKEITGVAMALGAVVLLGRAS
jgi:drug/metabolite transporter (DMT)-like permease